MQKKLIALAVAGLVSAPAFAQSNVQIYGVMDLGFRHLSGSEENGAHPGLKSRSGIDSSGQSTSRLGFRGTEDLGNGLKAFFTIESQLNPDRSSQTTSDRQAFLGLEGGFGRVWLGRDFNPSRALISGLDPFGATGIGSGQQLFQQTTRYDNAIMYRTPSFGGLTVAVAYSNNISGDEEAELKGAGDANTKGWSVTPVYKNGPLTVGFGYEKYSDVSGTVDDRKRWNLGGGYDFGIVDLRLAYGQTKDDLVGGGSNKRKSWMLAGVIPVTERGKILASYVQTKLDVSGGGDQKAKQYAIGYSHDLSKRTAVYATYAKISTNNAAEGNYSLGMGNPGSYDTRTVADDGFDGRAAYTSGFNIGIRHNF